MLYVDVRVRPSKKKVGGVSPNVQISLLFSLKVSAEVSKVKYNPGVQKLNKNNPSHPAKSV